MASVQFTNFRVFIRDVIGLSIKINKDTPPIDEVISYAPVRQTNKNAL